MIKPVKDQADSSNVYQDGYQQALNDFGISDLLERLSNFSDSGFNAQELNLKEEELDSITALLIEQLTASLKGSLIADYLSAIRHGDDNGISELLLVDRPLSQATTLPTKFCPPRFWCGEHLRWKSWGALVETDFGVVIGRFYCPAPHRSMEWGWKYLILLDKDSPSSVIVAADTAWEEDLEPWEKEETQ